MEGMAAFCECTFDGHCDFQMTKTLKARKLHKCCECGTDIWPGEIYERCTGKWEGEISTFATCRFCAGMRRDFAPCSCFGELDTILTEELGMNVADIR